MTTLSRFIQSFFISIALMGVSHLPAEAPPTAAEIKHKSRDLNKLKSELKQKQEERERLKREANALSDKIFEEGRKAKNLEQTLAYTHQKTVTVEREMAQTKNIHDQLLAHLEDAKKTMNESLKTYYVASLITGPATPVTAYNRQMVRLASGNFQSMVQKNHEARERLQDLVYSQQLLRTEFERQASSLNKVRSGLEQQEKLLNKKKTRQEILGEELKNLEHTAQELASLIDILRTKVKQEAEQERKDRLEKQERGPAPILGHSLPWPVSGKVVTQFGRQTHPMLGTPFISNGLVIHTQEAQSVRVVADGQVLYVGPFMSYGSMALVEHKGDWYTVYGRLGRWNVEKGQALKKGDAVGSMGASAGGGLETYFELRFYGKPTDPLPWLAK